MKKSLFKRNSQGFTLTELLVVVGIIAILTAIAVPLYQKQQSKAAESEAYANLEAIRLLEEQFFASNGRYTPSDATVLNYTMASTTIRDGAGVQQGLTGFRPSGLPNRSDLNYDYQLFSPTGNGTDFRATATGRARTLVAGQIYWINQNGEKNY